MSSLLPTTRLTAAALNDALSGTSFGSVEVLSIPVVSVGQSVIEAETGFLHRVLNALEKETWVKFLVGGAALVLLAGFVLLFMWCRKRQRSTRVAHTKVRVRCNPTHTSPDSFRRLQSPSTPTELEDSEGLPPGWQEFDDDNTGEKYFFNADSRTTTWTKPKWRVVVSNPL